MNYDAWKTTNPADAYLSQEEVDDRELDNLKAEIERLHAGNIATGRLNSQLVTSLADAAAELERLRAEVERLERENKRLRWLLTVAQAVR